MLRLVSIFFPYIAASSVMSARYQNLLQIIEANCNATNAIAKKWHMLFKGSGFSQRYVKGKFNVP